MADKILSTSSHNLIKLGHKTNCKIIHCDKKTPSATRTAQLYTFVDIKNPQLEIEYGEKITPRYNSNVLYPENHSTLLELINKQEELKMQLEGFTGEELRERRLKTSPFDLLPLGNLINKAAWKLIEINHLSDNIFFRIGDKKFADICCAPGGFTHTILTKNHQMYTIAHLITLGDIKINKTIACNQSKKFSPTITYGDVTRYAIQMRFIESCGVHQLDFAMADGGFNFKNIEREQEFECRRLTISQIYLALVTIKEDGFFLLKLFNIYSRFSQSLLYATASCFGDMQIIKPLSSRPANSEKYILFKDYKPNAEVIVHLETLMRMSHDQLSHVESVCTVPSSYINQMNNALGEITKSQIAALELYIEPVVDFTSDFNVDETLGELYDNNNVVEHLQMSTILSYAKKWNS